MRAAWPLRWAAASSLLRIKSNAGLRGRTLSVRWLGDAGGLDHDGPALDVRLEHAGEIVRRRRLTGCRDRAELLDARAHDRIGDRRLQGLRQLRAARLRRTLRREDCGPSLQQELLHAGLFGRRDAGGDCRAIGL